MPSVTVFIPESRLTEHATNVPGFVASVTGICTDVIGAALDNVQILLVPTLPVLQGPPGYIEVKLRAGPSRSAAAMDRFMAGLDDASRVQFGCRMRIRCFTSGADTLFARN